MTKDMAIAGGQRRRRTAAEKAQIVRESLMAGASVAEVARRHGVNPNLIYAWRQRNIGASSAAAEDHRCLALVAVTAANGRAGLGGYGEYTSSMIEVILRNGRVLRLSECAAPSRVAPLADALEECRS
jgi:transposase